MQFVGTLVELVSFLLKRFRFIFLLLTIMGIQNHQLHALDENSLLLKITS